MNPKKSFNLRSFTSFSLVISTIVMSWSGFILYVAPPGRIANWGDWRLMLFTKSEWQALHTIFSYIFFILVIIHLFFVNWKTFMTYIKSKVKSGVNKRWELAAAVLFSGIFFLGTLQSWTPFGPVMSFGEKVKESWEKDYVSPPVAHMEEYTLTRLSSDYGEVAVEAMIQTLSDSSILVSGPEMTLKEIAVLNKITPSRIYDVLKSKYKQNVAPDKKQAPAGVGKMTVNEIAVRLERPAAELTGLLKGKNIEATGESTMRTIADQMGISPHDLYTLLAAN